MPTVRIYLERNADLPPLGVFDEVPKGNPSQLSVGGYLICYVAKGKLFLAKNATVAEGALWLMPGSMGGDYARIVFAGKHTTAVDLADIPDFGARQLVKLFPLWVEIVKEN
ncbi:MAG TPA: hypothetical protein VGM05_22040 [Planctomycetaceae bacterium]